MVIDLWKFADEYHLRRPMNQWDIDYPAPAMRLGMEVEMEHTEETEIAAVIAAHHLDEDELYYETLKSVGL
jgi:hypothetical protein